MSTSEPEAVVELTIPCRPEYVGVARLAILGVASRMRFSYDEVEDIRLAVGEACTSVLDRIDDATNAPPIRIRSVIDAGRLTIEVEDAARIRPAADGDDPLKSLPDDAQLGSVLIRILMDEVTTEDDPATGNHVIRMVKYVAR